MSDGADSRRDGVARDLEAAIHQARDRTPSDALDPGIPVAGTVVLARDGADGPEVLLIERPDRGSFAGAWVFPGGKLEPGDRADPGSEEDDARRAAVRETREETGLDLGTAALQTLSCWDPPPGLALRIRTWFFAARAPGGELVLSADEAVSAMWARPEDVLGRHGRGELTLYPPTWVTLYELTGAQEVAALLDRARIAGIGRFESQLRRTPEGPLFLWPEDAAYDDPALDAVPGPRHRLETGRLPWSYLRSE